MLKLALFLPLAIGSYAAEITAQEAFDRARQEIAHQLSAVANYTCVLTIDRNLYVQRRGPIAGCTGSDRKAEKPFMHDRLRMDVAVSEGDEIFGWHGGRKFSPSGVSDLVKTGPISSGSFVGYLRNILFTHGVAISLDKSGADGKTYKFQYYVPVKSSAYQIRARRGKFIVPYHGSFAVSSDTFALQSLSVNAGEIPRIAEVCSAETDIAYQNVELAGKSQLIPKSFQLHLVDTYGMDTFNQSEYTQCREFRGESTIRFDFDDSEQAQSKTAIHDEWLPAGLDLHVRLITPLTDQQSFTGDPVQGVLLNPVHVKSLDLMIPKGAVISGVVSKMEQRFEPAHHYVVAVHWDRLTFGQNSLLMSANPKRSFPQGRRLGAGIPGRRLDLPGDEAREETSFTWPSRHFRMDQSFTAHYETTERPKETTNGN